MSAPCLDLEPDKCKDYECHREPWRVDDKKVLVEGKMAGDIIVRDLMLDNNSSDRTAFRYSTADDTDWCAHVSGP